MARLVKCAVCHAATEKAVRLRTGRWHQVVMPFGAHVNGWINCLVCSECQAAVIEVLKKRMGLNQGKAIGVDYESGTALPAGEPEPQPALEAPKEKTASTRGKGRKKKAASR